MKEIEIIAINDGSTDTSLDIITKLAQNDPRIRIISTSNNGLSIARNLGMYTATGEYIYFFDSDDILERNTLEECYTKCQAQNLDFVFFDADCFTDSAEKEHSFNYQRTEKYEDKVHTGKDILQRQIVTNGYSSSVCLSFINKDFLKKENLFFYPKILHEDQLFTFLLYLKANRVGLLKSTFFHRRVRANSIMTSSFGMRNAMGYLTVCRELKNYDHSYHITQEQRRVIKERIIYLLFEVIYRLDLFTKDERKELKQFIKKEFQPYFNVKMRLKLDCPRVFTLLKKIKNL